MRKSTSTIHRGGRPPKYDWPRYDPMLGTTFDGDIAKMIGGNCADVTVLKRRRKLGIPPYQPRNGFDRKGRRVK